MPRERQPPRLWKRPASKDRASVYIILDGGRQISTGCRANDDEGAKAAFATYLCKNFQQTKRIKERAASEVPIAEVVANYLTVKGDSVARPKELAQRMDAILDWWGGKTLDDVSALTCRQYTESRTTTSQARRELEDLRAAIGQAIADKICRHTITVTLPQKPKSRTGYLERKQVAKLLRAAYRKREIQRGKPTSKRPTLHVARFIICAVYTGSRASRIWRASFEKEIGRPWVDLESGNFYRMWEGERQTKKAAPPIRLPSRLLVHMRRWKAQGARYVVEYQGRAADPKKAFAKLVAATLPGVDFTVVRHTFRHTLATWLMRDGVNKFEAGGYLGMTQETLERVYGHHSPDYQGGVDRALSNRNNKRAVNE
jgi:integrase